jgi:biotin synthase
MADAARKRFAGDEVHLRGLIEISNVCIRQCAYCGLRAGNTRLERYRMTTAEIMACVCRAEHLEYGTVVLQGGEDYGMSREWVSSLIKHIKSETPLAVTLSLGERPEADLTAWREAGADRYLLRFETSDPALYGKIHPSLSSGLADRLTLLRVLKALGYEIGGGVMIGIPGQSYRSLVEDILHFRSLDLDMIGVGPFIPHPETPLGSDRGASVIAREQVPSAELMVYKVIALARLICPEANIPSTTALATVNRTRGYELGLMRGANVIMPNLTPLEYRVKYEVYPNKISSSDVASGIEGIHHRIESVGRTIGKGPGKRTRSGLEIPTDSLWDESGEQQ